MNRSPAAPVSDSTSIPDLIAQLRATATRVETPCGDGSLVWHLWGEPRPGAAPVVLLHGGSGSWTHWVRNIEALAQTGLAGGRQVLVPDLPGMGDSALPPGARDADGLPEPLEAGLRILLDGAAASDPAPAADRPVTACDLVGFSFGGLTAGLWAAAFPARVRRLVVVGAPGLGVASRRTVPLTSWRHLADPAAVAAAHHKNLAALMLFDPQAIDPLAMRLHAANVVRDRMPTRRLAYTDALKQALARITAPVAALYGREDALYVGKLDRLGEALAVAPNFEGLTLIEAAGHWVQFERADAFNAALRALLARS